MAEEENFIGLDLEDTLGKDDEGEERDRLCNDLEVKADALKKAIDAGAAQEVYHRLERQYAGYVAAIGTVRAFWAQTHKKA